MNWFTRSFVSTVGISKKISFVEQHGGCEHVQADPALLFAISYENDSFGREGYCQCEACFDAAQVEADEEEVVCFDCKTTVKAKDSVSWKWYDFYAPQGDEPLIICNTCQTKEKHRQRVARDQADYEHEMARYDEE